MADDRGAVEHLDAGSRGEFTAFQKAIAETHQWQQNQQQQQQQLQQQVDNLALAARSVAARSAPLPPDFSSRL